MQDFTKHQKKENSHNFIQISNQILLFLPDSLLQKETKISKNAASN